MVTFHCRRFHTVPQQRALLQLLLSAVPAAAAEGQAGSLSEGLTQLLATSF
jgi:hypothetical protein